MHLGVMGLLACGPKLDSVSPESGSARGGEWVTVEGRGLDTDATIRFDGVASPELRSAGRNAVEALTPPGFAGSVDVSVDGGQTLEDAYDYQALELAFSQAASHFLPEAPGQGLRAVRGGDLDADGADDVVLVQDDGSVWLWWSQGALVQAEDPIARGGVDDALVVDLDADGVSELVLCGRGMSPWVWGLDAEMPDAATSCSALSAQDLDGDGLPELLLIHPGAGVRVLWNEGGLGFSAREAGEPTPWDSCGALTPAEGVTATCEVDVEMARVTLAGGNAELRWALPVDSVPQQVRAALRLDAGAAQVQAMLVDGAGLRAPADVQALEGSDWVTLDFSEFEGSGDLGEGLSVVLSLQTTATAELSLDAVRAELPSGATAWVAPFDDAAADGPSRSSLGGASAGDLDGDGLPELMAQGPDGVILFLSTGDAWVPLEGRGSEGVCTAAASAAVHDGDLVVACAGQDRLLRNDGQAWFFDDSAGSMPLDSASATGLWVADLDRDRKPDLLIPSSDGVDRLYQGDGAGFVDQTPLLDLSVHDTEWLLPLDTDGDGDSDVLAVDRDGLGVRLYVHVGE